MVILTIGRHAVYDVGSFYPLSAFGVADVIWQTEYMLRHYPKPDIICSSFAGKCQLTAKIRRKVMRDEPRFLLEEFWEEWSQPQLIKHRFQEILQRAEEKNWKHVHIIVGQRVIDVLCPGAEPVSMGNWLTLTAKSWDEVKKHRFELKNPRRVLSSAEMGHDFAKTYDETIGQYEYENKAEFERINELREKALVSYSWQGSFLYLLDFMLNA